MLLTQLDMPTARYAFAFLAKGEICQKARGFISYRIDAERQYIELARSESISSSSFVNIFHESEYIDRRKTRARIEGFSPFTLALSVCNMGMGLAHLRLTDQMRCSHFAVLSNSPIRTSHFLPRSYFSRIKTTPCFCSFFDMFCSANIRKIYCIFF